MTNNTINTRVRAVAVAAVLGMGLIASPALAHPGHEGGLVAGLTHPLTGLDHLLAMVAVGLWAATREAKRAWQAPAMFLSCLMVGGVLGVVAGPVAAVEPLVSGSLLVLAVLLIAAPFIGDRAGLTLIGAFALLHGHAHGGEASGLVAAYFVGFLMSSAALHLAGWRIGSALFVSPAGRWLAGLGIGAAGLALTFA